MTAPLNQCTAYNEDFSSLRAFDAHVLSKPSEPTFDCVTVAQMVESGWATDERGRWSSPALRASARRLAEHHLRTASEPVEVTKAA
jgi:hypothetical protein